MITTDSKITTSSSGTPVGRLWFFAVLLGLVFALAISRQSFWIDELYVALAAQQPTVDGWWREIFALKGSDLQMPLYMLWSWGCGRIVGTTEVALRAVNLFWILPGMLALLWALARDRSLQFATLLVAALSPFAWYYLNEARPYAMQIGTSLIVFALLFRLALNQDKPSRERLWVAGSCVASVLLAGSSMLAMLWLGAYLGAAMLSAPKDRLRALLKTYWPWWAGTSLLLFLLGLYYLWTLRQGARATTAGITDAKNLFFIVYELFGFSGWGPGRLTIRTGGLEAFRPWLPGLAIYSATLLVVLTAGCRSVTASFSRRTLLWWILAVALVFGFILAVGVAVRFRVLGRHCAPLLPLVLFVLGSGLAALLKRRDWAGRLAVAAFVGLSLVSCLSLRFSERHAKDDYRGAAALGREALARGETVWWNAEKYGGIIYQVPMTEQPSEPGHAVLLINPEKGFEHDRPKPDLVLTSKADLFDSNGALADYLVRSGFQRTTNLTAFTVWRAGEK
ncbi:MAG: hypothetical protein WAO02_16645 [Verrucomicrobiia bacterium]